MKKDLKTAMAKNFQKMVNEQPNDDTPSKKSEAVAEKATEKKEVKKTSTTVTKPTETNTPVMNEPVEIVQEPVQVSQPVQNIQTMQDVTMQTQPIVQPVQQPVPQPIPQPMVQQIAEPVVQVQPQPIPVQQQVPVYVQTPFNSFNPSTVEGPVTAPMNAQIAPTVVTEQHNNVKSTSKKSIPLMPEEKSSGVLHIRLGELRSYVDFMTQSGKLSYQQYISNLIEQDYEKNKDLYLKYKSFMEQLNM